MKPSIKILGVDDIAEKEQYFKYIVDNIAERNMFPEHDITTAAKEDRVLSMMEYSECSNVLVAQTETSTAFCVYYVEQRNPHIDGQGLVLLLTVAFGEDKLLPLVLNKLRRFAKHCGCRWLLVHKRVAPCEYRCSYRILH